MSAMMRRALDLVLEALGVVLGVALGLLGVPIRDRSARVGTAAGLQLDARVEIDPPNEHKLGRAELHALTNAPIGAVRLGRQKP